MLDLDRQSRKPLYEQIAEKYKNLIASGVLLPNELLPDREQLVKEFSLNPHTVQKALELLENEGYIYLADGNRIFVAERGNWELKEQQAFFRSMKQMVRQGKRLHITREELLGRVEEYLMEET